MDYNQRLWELNNSFFDPANLAAFGFITSALQLLIAHVIGSPRCQELGKAGMIGSVVGLVAVFFAPQIMATVHATFGS